MLSIVNQLNEPTITDALGRLPKTRPAASTLPYFDVSGDGLLSPIDALRIINELNRSGDGEGEADELASHAELQPVNGRSSSSGSLGRRRDTSRILVGVRAG